MTRIEEVERLREAVIKKHFPSFAVNSALDLYHGLYEKVQRQEHWIDEKVLFYVKLGLSAEDVEKSIKRDI